MDQIMQKCLPINIISKNPVVFHSMRQLCPNWSSQFARISKQTLMLWNIGVASKVRVNRQREWIFLIPCHLIVFTLVEANWQILLLTWWANTDSFIPILITNFNPQISITQKIYARLASILPSFLCPFFISFFWTCFSFCSRMTTAMYKRFQQLWNSGSWKGCEYCTYR